MGRGLRVASRKTPPEWMWAYHATPKRSLPGISKHGLRPTWHTSVKDAPVVFVEPEVEGVEPYIAEGGATIRFKTPGFGCTEDGEDVVFGGSANKVLSPDPPFVGKPGEDGVIPRERIQVLRGDRWGWLAQLS